MIEPDFNNYSLILLSNNKKIFTSTESGLKPLVQCVDANYKKFENCILCDKIIGLAAARIIVYSQIIDSVITQVASVPAQKFLSENNIKIKAEQSVDKILCPMEKKAQISKNNKLFFQELLKKYEI